MSSMTLFRAENSISLPPMRAWQERTVGLIREAIREGHRRIVVQAPTGAGKTLLSAHLFAGSIAKGKRPLFTVPDISLVEQTIRSFERVGICDVGVIQANHVRTDAAAQVQVASVQSLVRRELPDVDMVITDECHVSYSKFLALIDGPVWADKVVIGLSATPWASGMGHHWTKLIIGATITELIEQGVLCGFHGYGPSVDADLSNVHTVAGEYNERESSAAMRKTAIVADVVEQWQKHGTPYRTFMFCVDRAHAKEQQAKFEAAGIPFGYIDGTMTVEEREPVFEAFRQRHIVGIASVGCLSRGVDEDVRCIIDACPTKSEMSYVQKIGRGLRIAPGKDKLLILDHAGNAMRLGTVTDIYHDTLDTRMPGSKEKAFSKDKTQPAQKCPKCNSIVQRRLAKCDLCGYVLRVVSAVTHLKGELTEFGSERKRKDKPAEDRQGFYSGCLALAQQRGFSEGWAAYRYKARYGVFPRGLAKVAVKPNAEVMAWDKHERIKWAKSKARTDKIEGSGVISAG